MANIEATCGACKNFNEGICAILKEVRPPTSPPSDRLIPFCFIPNTYDNNSFLSSHIQEEIHGSFIKKRELLG